MSENGLDIYLGEIEAQLGRPLSDEEREHYARSFVETQGPRILDELAKGFPRGAGMIIEGVGAVVRMLSGDQAGHDAVKLGQTIQKEYAQHRDLQKNLWDHPELLGDPAWWAGGVSSLIPMIGGQGLTYGGLRLAGLGTRAAIGGAAGAAGALEGMPVFNELRDEDDASLAEASAIALLNSAGIGALNLLPLGAAFSRATGGVIPRVATTGAAEGLTEFAEEPLQAFLTGDDLVEAAKAGLTVAPLAAVTGGALGGVGSLTQPSRPGPNQPLAPPPDQPGSAPPSDQTEVTDHQLPDAEPDYIPSPLERTVEGERNASGWVVEGDQAHYGPLAEHTALPVPASSLLLEGKTTVGDVVPAIKNDYPRIAKLPLQQMPEDPEIRSLGPARLTPTAIEIDDSLPARAQQKGFAMAVGQAIALEEGLSSPVKTEGIDLDTDVELTPEEGRIARNYAERLTPQESPEPVSEPLSPLQPVDLRTLSNLPSIKRHVFTQRRGHVPEPAPAPVEEPVDSEQAAKEDIRADAAQEARVAQEALDINNEVPAHAWPNLMSAYRTWLEDPSKPVPIDIFPEGTPPPEGFRFERRGKKDVLVAGSSSIAVLDPAAVKMARFSSMGERAAWFASRFKKEPTTVDAVHQRAMEQYKEMLGREESADYLDTTHLSPEDTAFLAQLYNAAYAELHAATRNYELSPTPENHQTMAEQNAAFKEVVRMWDATGSSWGLIGRIRQSVTTFRPYEEELVASALNQGPGAVAQVARTFDQAGFWDIVTELFRSVLLTGPHTWVVNAGSSALNSWMVSQEMRLASMISPKDVLAWREVSAYTSHNLFHWGWGGLMAAKNAWSTEQDLFELGKIDQQRYGAISSQRLSNLLKRLGLNPHGRTGFIIDKIGKHAVRLSFRILMSTDAFFKYGFYQKWLHFEAAQHIQKKHPGISDKAYRKAYERFVETELYKRNEVGTFAHKAMHERAIQHALQNTFNKDPGFVGHFGMELVNRLPIFGMVFPFIRTPVNIIDFSMQRTPVAFLMREPKAALMGKAGKNKHERHRNQALAWSRFMLGGSIMGLTGLLAAAGLITGAPPRDPEEERLWRAAGNQPYSLYFEFPEHMGGPQWIAYGRVEPLGVLMGFAADFVSIRHAMDDSTAAELASAAVGGLVSNFMEKTWLSGMARMFQALQNPERYGPQYVQKMIGSFVPAGVAAIERVQDPHLRYATTALEEIRSRLPAMSGELPLRYDAFGRKIELAPDYVPGWINIINPFYIRQYKDDPVAQELIKHKVTIPQVGKKILDYELTGFERQDYQKIAGQLLHQQLGLLVRSALYQSASNATQTEMLEKVRARARRLSRKLFLTQHPEIKLKQRLLELEQQLLQV